MTVPSVSRARAHALVAAGSAAGAVLRVLAGWAASPLLGDAWSTVLVNVLGCFAIGAVAAMPALARWWPLVGPGLLGGFTTFSAFIVLLDGASPREAAILVVVTLVACPVAALLGERTVTRAR
ncbi:fluoride efflux transporter FluC [Corynebacterium hansenii]|uniref:Fluoride-specific ion channel FluC n=1 Tax=Corynebacterium hansenii TaxID=394964 RepID=A0ABV7ZK70_9CORY|nr:CrcB family protein [Corynebacterium hansenii]WJY99216.1 camphor resistance protein CrcB [Corynebacterium hansenii]